MKTIAFLSQKGGSGKTTLAVHTAVAATEDGERVVIVDTDIQHSATTWSRSPAAAGGPRCRVATPRARPAWLKSSPLRVVKA